MKTKIALFFALALAAVPSMAATNNSLTGTYAVHTADCLGAAVTGAVFPLTLKITADDQQVRLQLSVNVPGYSQPGLSDVYGPFGVGTSDFTMLGGSLYRYVGTYSADGSGFTNTEFDNEFAGGPLNELRSLSLTRNQGALVMTQTESGFAPKTCIMSKL